VTAKIYLTNSPFTTSMGGSEAIAGVTSISPGDSATLTFTLDISPNAELKTYNLEMDLTSTISRYPAGVTSKTTVSVPLLGEVRFSANLSPKTIYSGPNIVTLNLTNEGSATASAVEVVISVPSPLVAVAEDTLWRFSQVRPSESLTVNMELYAPSSSKGSAYTISATLSYSDGYGFERSSSVSAGVIVEDPVIKPIMTIKLEDGEIAAGVVNKVNFTLENEGLSDARDVSVTLTLPTGSASLAQTTTTSPLILVGEDNFWHFDLIKFQTSTYFPAYITTGKDIVGTYRIDLTLTYKDVRGQLYTETRSVGLEVFPNVPSSNINLESYKISPEIVYKGDIFTLTLNLKNFGDFGAQSVTVGLQPPELFAAISPSVVNLGGLAPNSTKSVEYTLMASPTANSGVVHVFKIDISYTDRLGVRQATTNYIGVPLHGRVELVVYDVSTSPSPAEIGNEFTLSFTVLNRGTAPAMYTNVSVIPEFPFQQALGGFPYIGELDPNAPAPISLTAIVSPEAGERDYPLKLSIYYRDEYNQPQTVNQTVNVRVAPPLQIEKESEATQTSSGLLPIAVAAVATVVVLALIASRLKGRRKHSTPTRKNQPL
ncbi:MAG: hypothetical protein QXJ75_05970, partial [Candidatus Bathyarchaeia archaeon]